MTFSPTRYHDEDHSSEGGDPAQGRPVANPGDGATQPPLRPLEPSGNIFLGAFLALLFTGLLAFVSGFMTHVLERLFALGWGAL